MTKSIITWMAIMVTVMVCVPIMALWFSEGDGAGAELELVPLEADGDGVIVPVYVSATKQVKRLPLEEYVRGVVAAEMPASFELEALKAQALVARTYIVQRMAQGEFSDVPAGAYVTDTIQHQVHLSDEQLREKWGTFDYILYMNKINKAVNETKGQILVYEGKPINATFFFDEQWVYGEFGGLLEGSAALFAECGESVGSGIPEIQIYYACICEGF